MERHPEFIGLFFEVATIRNRRRMRLLFSEEVDVEKVKEEKKNITKMAKESVPMSWSNSTRTTISVDAEVRGCDDRRARIVLQIAAQQLGGSLVF